MPELVFFASKDTETMTSKKWMWLFCQMPCLQPPNLDDFATSASLGVLQIYFSVVGRGVERVVSILLLSPGGVYSSRSTSGARYLCF